VSKVKIKTKVVVDKGSLKGNAVCNRGIQKENISLNNREISLIRFLASREIRESPPIDCKGRASVLIDYTRNLQFVSSFN